MEAYPVKAVKIEKVNETSREVADDLLAVEEPLELRLKFGPENQRRESRLAVTMRTVGHDFELAYGFLYTEDIIRSAADVREIRYCTELTSPEEENNVLLISLRPEVAFDEKALQRHFYTTSSCGVCGKASLDALENQQCSIMADMSLKVPASLLPQLSEMMRAEQAVFKHTGGLHAAALFDPKGNLILHREDIGRHNAVDKVIGAFLQNHQPPFSDVILWVSGRGGFELVQKAVVAGIPVLAAVGAPSSLAADLARKFNLTLIGFLRDKRFNIYSAPERIA